MNEDQTMNGQLKLSVDQVLVAIRLLDPVEKRELQAHLPDLFGASEYMIKRGVSEPSSKQQLKQRPPRYSFSMARKLLSDVQENMSTQIIADREDRI